MSITVSFLLLPSLVFLQTVVIAQSTTVCTTPTPTPYQRFASTETPTTAFHRKNSNGEENRSTWKQCVWNTTNATDDGLIHECNFTVESCGNSLHVVYSGVNRVYCNGYQECCSRWYFTFDGDECDDPAPIDLVVFKRYTEDSPYRTRQMEGYCDKMPNGVVTVGLHVGTCKGMIDELANAYTGWNEKSPSRILVQEMGPPQDQSESMPPP
ncbi:collagen triple helix repeat-containing protein 1-like [Corticium candelabrum]|uniref:collagen triple helix repeat-containing protein 1-like n=1 Tax=Corticium candelabrum TaxID=121492 RepID=UPI002E254B0D|nr:collagen triple helix repeat-containing protein 1-like [Corticium candelabrum]